MHQLFFCLFLCFFWLELCWIICFVCLNFENFVHLDLGATLFIWCNIVHFVQHCSFGSWCNIVHLVQHCSFGATLFIWIFLVQSGGWLAVINDIVDLICLFTHSWFVFVGICFLVFLFLSVAFLGCILMGCVYV